MKEDLKLGKIHTIFDAQDDNDNEKCSEVDVENMYKRKRLELNVIPEDSDSEKVSKDSNSSLDIDLVATRTDETKDFN